MPTVEACREALEKLVRKFDAGKAFYLSIYKNNRDLTANQLHAMKHELRLEADGNHRRWAWTARERAAR